MSNATKIPNRQIYAARIEPSVLKLGNSYISLRACVDSKILRKLEEILENWGQNFVVLPWVSPPFGRIVGYGIYAKKDAEMLRRRAQQEEWGFPVPGLPYDLATLRRK